MYIKRLKNLFSELSGFVKNVSNDERIPERDKKVLLVLVALIISPIDLIPDWIPIIGVLDDLIILAIVLDYLFNVLDQNILLSHYPWGMKSYTWIRRLAKTVTRLTPTFIKNRIWKYKPDPY